MTNPPAPVPTPVSATGKIISTGETPQTETAAPPASLTPPKPKPLPKASALKEALKTISLQFPSQLDDLLRLQREQVELLKELIQAVKQQPAATTTETKTDSDKPTAPNWSLDPVPASYEGMYATFTKDKETNEWIPIVPIWCLTNPLEVYEHEGRSWKIIPTISRDNQVGKVAIASDSKMSAAFKGKEWSRYPGEQMAFCYWWSGVTCDKWTLPPETQTVASPAPAPAPEPQPLENSEYEEYEEPF